MEDFSFFTLFEFDNAIALFYLHLGSWGQLTIFKSDDYRKLSSLDIK